MALCFASMTEADIDHILPIEQASFKKPWSRLLFLDELSCETSRSYTVTAKNSCKNNEIIAYICFRLIVDEMHILKIASANQWQKQGVASRLLGHSLNVARESGATAAFLEVRISNDAAIKLYHNLGFQVIGQRPNYYPESGEHALVMKKELWKKRLRRQNGH